MTVRIGDRSAMLPVSFLSAPDLIKQAVEWLAAYLRTAIVAIYPLRRTDAVHGVKILFDARPLTINPKFCDDYDAGYQAALSVSRKRSLRDIHVALQTMLPVDSEFEWGAFDALADEARHRGRPDPVL